MVRARERVVAFFGGVAVRARTRDGVGGGGASGIRLRPRRVRLLARRRENIARVGSLLRFRTRLSRDDPRALELPARLAAFRALNLHGESKSRRLLLGGATLLAHAFARVFVRRALALTLRAFELGDAGHLVEVAFGLLARAALHGEGEGEVPRARPDGVARFEKRV